MRMPLVPLQKFKKLAMYLFIAGRYYLDLLIDKIFSFFCDQYYQPLITETNPLVLESATFLARQIREKQVSSEQVVRAFIDRIKEVNFQLNAVVDERFDGALEEARKIDEMLKSGSECTLEEKPFLGVPFTTKESCSAQGLSHTFGLLHRKGRKANHDSEVVRKMKEAGAILIAVTNVPQLNLWQETCNPLYGTTNNPYDVTRTAGGSCGGEASIIAACGSPFGIGTDVAGSLRLPSFMCGIFGHKPTADLISNQDLTIKPMNAQNSSLMSAGPMTKHAEDLAPLLKILCGENCQKLKLDESVNIREIKVFYAKHPKDILISSFRSEMKETLKSVLDYLERISDQKPQLLLLDELKYGSRISKYWMTRDPNANIKRNFLDAKKEGTNSPVGTLMKIYKELFKVCTGKSKYNMPMILNLINGFLPQEDPTWAEETTDLLKRTLTDLLGDHGVLLYPSAPWPACYHHTALLRPWNFNLFSIWNALKFPSTQVPLGLSRGLPVGIQIVAGPYQDHLCLAVAEQLERGFGGHVPVGKCSWNRSSSKSGRLLEENV